MSCPPPDIRLLIRFLYISIFLTITHVQYANSLDKREEGLLEAVADGNLSEVKSLLEKYPHLMPCIKKDKIGESSLLLEGVRSCNTAIVSFLIKNGANVNPELGKIKHGANGNPVLGEIQSRYSGTDPLQMAVEQFNLEMVSVLVKAGASMDSVTFGGQTPLATLAWEYKPTGLWIRQNSWGTRLKKRSETEYRSDRMKIARILIDAGAKLNIDLPPLLCVFHRNMFVFERGSKKIDLTFAKFLISQGAKVNHRSNSHTDNLTGGETALHFAVLSGDIKAIRFLLDYGANKKIATVDGLTPLQLASKELAGLEDYLTGNNEALVSIAKKEIPVLKKAMKFLKDYTPKTLKSPSDLVARATPGNKNAGISSTFYFIGLVVVLVVAGGGFFLYRLRKQGGGTRRTRGSAQNTQGKTSRNRQNDGGRSIVCKCGKKLHISAAVVKKANSVGTSITCPVCEKIIKLGKRKRSQ